MKQWIKPLAVLAASASLFACDGDDYDSDIKNLRQTNDELSGEVSDLNSENTQLASDIADLRAQLTQAGADQTALQAQIAALEEQLALLQGGKPLTVTLLHMNDHHSHLEAESLHFPVDQLSLAAKAEGDAAITSVDINYGGFPMLVSLFDDLTKQSINPVKIHAGDAMTGTLYNTLFKGEADAAMMNQVCFDVFAPGNHEFDAGDAGLARFLDDLNGSGCNTATVAANVQPHANSALAQDYLQPYTIKDFGGEKVGFIGIDIAGKTKNSSFPDEGTTFSDETATAQAVIDQLTAEGVNKIVLVTHYQYAKDQALASALHNVDVIVGGDSHSLLGDDTFTALGFNTVGDYPTQVQNLDGNPVCIVHAWEYAHLLGRLEVNFNAAGVVESCTGNPIVPMEASFSYAYSDSETRVLEGDDAYQVRKALAAHDEIAFVAADAATADILQTYQAQTDVLKQTLIGTVSEDLCLVRWPGDSRSSLCDRMDTYAYGSDISNIVAKAFLMVTPEADIAIQNGGGVRVDVPMGNYSIGDAYVLLPFSNTLVVLEMTGQQVVNVLEDALSYALDEAQSTGAYPYASGLRYNVDASAAKGSRVSNVEVNARVAGSWTPINLANTYKVVTNNFIASGQDGYTTFETPFKAGNYVDTYTEYAQGFVTYMQLLADDNDNLMKLPFSEYSTQVYIGRDGCNHSTQTNCVDY
ncbi:5'-nucleotidase C-terminal domain-containing protein [Teredinibacter turnerae]|uniref:5'-nucleotidase C-terminal domain-containing protein n=1 Tax=Teredinibacter turnerae TaxID=2426 RepID=UPI00035C7B8A|nr:5'-nucleotidase C-terminal domain-containing protein [Teredinibacter turnerae]